MKTLSLSGFKANPTQQRENTNFKASPKNKFETIQRLATESMEVLGIDADGFQPSAREIAVDLGKVVERARLKAINDAKLMEALIKAKAAVDELKRKLGISVSDSLKS